MRFLIRLAVLGLAAFGAVELWNRWSKPPSTSPVPPTVPDQSYASSVRDDMPAAETVAPGVDATVAVEQLQQEVVLP